MNAWTRGQCAIARVAVRLTIVGQTARVAQVERTDRLGRASEAAVTLLLYCRRKVEQLLSLGVRVRRLVRAGAPGQGPAVFATTQSNAVL